MPSSPAAASAQLGLPLPDPVQTVTDTTGQVTDTVTGALPAPLGGVVDTVTGDAGGVVNTVTGATGGVTDTVGQTVDQVLGGTLGTLPTATIDDLLGAAGLPGLNGAPGAPGSPGVTVLPDGTVLVDSRPPVTSVKILNTTRQVGAAVGSAVVGALLQSRLAGTLHDQAVAHAGALPPAYRDQFVAAFSSVATNGFQIGAGQNGAKLPPGLPPAVAQQLTALAHDVFVSGYIDALKQTLVVPILVLALTAFSALLIKRYQRSVVEQDERVSEEVTAAAS